MAEKSKDLHLTQTALSNPAQQAFQPSNSEEVFSNPSDVKQLGMGAAIGSLSYVFWVVGGMEMVERLAFYGVKAVATLYAKDPISKGGLGISMSAFGNILMTWALVQTLLPIFTGGLSDRYGYKETIFVSTLIKISGYLTMAVFPNYSGFFSGAILLAAGTAIFKPGIQGTLVKATSRENSSIAWGIFYQTVNIGGFLGPLVAGLMRKMSWSNVFYACAGIICLNFILLLCYREPGKEERLERNQKVKDGKAQHPNLIRDSLIELRKPHIWVYLIVFSGFWFMLNAFFDVLPAHIEDWVNTRVIVETLFGSEGATSKLTRFFVVMNQEGTEVLPEGIINVNAAMIMITCFIFAYLSGKIRATSSMVLGTILATISILMIGSSTSGWLLILAIAVFSIGEMLASPKFSEYIGNIAPDDKKGMYLGFSQIPLAIGWTLEGKIGPMLYSIYASKDEFSRQFLMEKGMESDLVTQIPTGEAFDRLVAFTGESPQALTSIMYQNHNVGMVWYIISTVGFISAFGIYLYGRWVITLRKP